LGRAKELGIDSTRIGVGGASAGGGLAAALALSNRERAIAPLAFQLLVYPMLDDRHSTVSSTMDLPVWSLSANRFGWTSYLGGRAGDDVEVLAAPARATDLRSLPKAYLCVGSHDRFLDEDVDYAVRQAHAGVHVDLRVYPGLPHGYDVVAPAAASVRRANKDLNDWLGRALHE
ncbi:MAG: alpha/beta hydrolase fold domain-containing protein, partial [Ilumatobacteraceae bacterium]